MVNRTKHGLLRRLRKDLQDTLDGHKNIGGDRSVGINLLLTKKCNFQCAHCMFRSGPEQPALYMSHQVLRDIDQFAADLQELGFFVSYNLVGGEPSLNLPKFAEICELVNEFGKPVEMTTNGWWIEKVKNLNAFARAVFPLAISGTLEHIRVSNSVYHQPHRKERSRWANGTPAILDEVHCWAREEGFTSEMYTDDPEEEKLEYLPLHWSAIEELSKLVYLQGGDEYKSNKVSPVGRALDNQFGSQEGYCAPKDNLLFTFNPDGTLHDFCCNGGNVPAGRAADRLALLWRRFLYMGHLLSKYPKTPGKSDHGERCTRCVETGAAWLKEQERQIGWTRAWSTPDQWTSAVDALGTLHKEKVWTNAK